MQQLEVTAQQILLKTCPLVDHVSLYDVVNTRVVNADLSHISSIP